jgi:hypothetical protein
MRMDLLYITESIPHSVLFSPENRGIIFLLKSISAYKTTWCQPKKSQCEFPFLFVDFLFFKIIIQHLMKVCYKLTKFGERIMSLSGKIKL